MVINMLEKYNSKRKLQMLNIEKTNKLYYMECIEFYDKKINEHTQLTGIYYELKEKALFKIEGIDIEIDFIERNIKGEE